MVKHRHVAIGALPAVLTTSAHAERPIYMIITDAVMDKAVLHESKCDKRVTSASISKLALAVTGFDHGLLRDEHTPVEHFKRGDPDWDGDAWRQPIDPTLWLKYSVVWYLQRAAHAMGTQTFQVYAYKLGYDNMDVNGNPSKNNGIDRSWIASSLKISPEE